VILTTRLSSHKYVYSQASFALKVNTGHKVAKYLTEHRMQKTRVKQKERITSQQAPKIPKGESSARYGILFGTRATNFITSATIFAVNKFAEKSPSMDHGQLFVNVYKLN